MDFNCAIRIHTKSTHLKSSTQDYGFDQRITVRAEISTLKGELHPGQKLTCFALYLKSNNTFVQNNVYILKQIVQRRQKWHWDFSRPRGF